MSCPLHLNCHATASALPRLLELLQWNVNVNMSIEPIRTINFPNKRIALSVLNECIYLWQFSQVGTISTMHLRHMGVYKKKGLKVKSYFKVVTWNCQYYTLFTPGGKFLCHSSSTQTKPHWTRKVTNISCLTCFFTFQGIQVFSRFVIKSLNKKRPGHRTAI